MFELDFTASIRHLTVAFVPLMLGIILHEVAHGWMALRRGDATAAMLGRLTLNPFPHIDPLGLFVFVITSLSGSFVFGWAKPVPINPRNFKHLVKDTMLVSAAGPGCNFLLAVAFALLLRFLLVIFPVETWGHDAIWIFFFLMFRSGILINLSLAWINLLPIPPLDGSNILWGLLPPSLSYHYMRLERYGMLILILMLATGMLGTILLPLVRGSFNGIVSLILPIEYATL